MQTGCGAEFFLAPAARRAQALDVPRQNAPRGMNLLRAHPLGWTTKISRYPHIIGFNYYDCAIRFSPREYRPIRVAIVVIITYKLYYMSNVTPFLSPERHALCREALALAARARAGGLMLVAMLLEMAAGEAANEAGLFGRAGQGRGYLRAIAREPMPKEPEALLAWARRHLYDEQQE